MKSTMKAVTLLALILILAASAQSNDSTKTTSTSPTPALKQEKKAAKDSSQTQPVDQRKARRAYFAQEIYRLADQAQATGEGFIFNNLAALGTAIESENDGPMAVATSIFLRQTILQQGDRLKQLQMQTLTKADTTKENK